MKNNFNLDELEEFLSESAEQHRLYPSDKVWRNINTELHGNKKWPALTFAALLTGAVITAGLILIHPDKSLLTSNISQNISQEESNHGKLVASNSKEVNELKTAHPGNTVPAFANSLPVDNGSFVSPGISLSNNPGTNAVASEIIVANNGSTGAQPTNSGDEKSENNYNAISENVGVLIGSGENKYHFNRRFESLVSESELKNFNIGPGAFNSENNNSKFASSVGLPSQKTKKWSSFFYVTPSISYRYLGEAKVVDLHYNGPVAPNLVNGVNKFVHHNPIMGFELGGGLMYQLTSTVRIRMGLQANVRGYSIDAYASRREPSTIVLNRGYYTDSIVSMSSISNMDGYQSLKITNRYFELSAPVSMDLQVASIKRVQFYVAAGLQPTYQFNRGMYMVSNDYKNYVQDPNLVRHFNMNSSIEAFMSYKAGGVTWQVGPQIRYQMLPGAIDQYPVRERLIDYGFKIGVVKTLH